MTACWFRDTQTTRRACSRSRSSIANGRAGWCSSPSVPRCPTAAGASTANVEASQPPLQGDIELERVTFRYGPNTQPVLREVSLKIPAGQVVGIVGPSGSGKSTIAKLLQRLYLPEQGRILIDGTDTGVIEPAWLRRQTGVVLQENILFNRSLRENIALVDPAIPLERVIAAARLAGAHEFICKMPQGYDTPIGERGVSLSGGQRQRIAIARAILADPRVLILDDATSAVDATKEHEIRAALAEVMRGRTTLVIAHRPATIALADRVALVDAGRVSELGTHAELLARSPRYRSLLALTTSEAA
jgi:ATP-binding cassette, subfamily B, bacterial HlyB/CyaB